MNARYGHSSLARAVAGVSLVAGILGSVGFASAATCDFPFPHKNKTCAQGSSKAVATHGLFTTTGPVHFELTIDMQGGENGAVAYGIDVNGNNLSTCAKTASDSDPRPRIASPFSCLSLYNTSGTAFSQRSYQHPIDMRFTHVVVI
ncbi:MAG TPA: hypothetical protein VJU61_28440 [Polyangiaceae bacterium]|nr:hypothetical protein [Polyangiaceae bacterium]